MTDADRKLLTEFCPEVGHYTEHSKLSVREKGVLIADALKRKIVELGEWAEFYQFCARRYKESLNLLWRETDESAVSCWLMDETRFPELIAGWLKEKRK